MRKWIFLIALLFGFFFLISRFAEIQEIWDVVQHGNLIYMSLALLVVFFWIFILGSFYHSVFQALGMKEERWHLMKLVTAANFMTVIAPSGGLSGIAIFIADAKHNKRSTAKVTVAGALYVWFEYIGTLTIVIFGLAQLAVRNNLHWAEVAASLLLLAGAIIIGLLLYLGMQSADGLGKVLARLARVVNTILRPFLRREYLHESRAYFFAHEVAEGLSALRDQPRWTIKPLFFALANKATLMLLLYLCFRAFNISVDASTVVSGLALASLFLIMSPTPAGIGFVEGILAVSLSTMGVPAHNSAVVTLAYRGFSFWFPLLLGMMSFRLLTHGRRPAITPAEVEATTQELSVE